MIENESPRLLRAEFFNPHVGSSFRIEFDDATYNLVLDNLKMLANHGSSREPFALYFLGQSDICLRQATYTLEHEELDAQEIFIVPVGTQDGRYLYEALFN